MDGMKLLLLADANSAHTVKWATGLSAFVESVNIFTLSSLDEQLYSAYSNVHIYSNNISHSTVRKQNGSAQKLSYLKTLRSLKKLIAALNPDIIHAHYASSYGLLGALIKSKPLVISVWGSDVFSFPKRSVFHRQIFKFNIHRANRVLSTSHVMAKEIAKYSTKKITVIPFGINLDEFKKEKSISLFERNDVVIGTIKTLEQVYRVDRLIRVFAKLTVLEPNLPLKLLIAGDGSLRGQLEQLVKELGITNRVVFAGKIEHSKVVSYYNMLDVFLALSESESFGVSVIEASACEVPVVVSNVGGLPEVVDNGSTGFVVPEDDIDFIAKKVRMLLKDKNLRSNLGVNGRAKVESEYDFSVNLKQMLNVYNDILKQ